MAGLTPTGFDKKTQPGCLQEMKADLWSSVSKGLNLSTAAPLGQILTRLSVREGIIWDALEAIHDARNPNASSGSALRALVNLTGTEAQVATKSLAKGCVVNVNAGFDQLPGVMVAALDTDPTALFTNVTEVSNTSGVAADITVDFRAVNPGPLAAPAGHLIVISQALSGWNSITNPLDAAPGLADDTDPTLRLRRETELQGGGSSTADAIKSDILKNLQSNITNCKVLTNDSDAVDANGLPPHSFEVLARGQDQGPNASFDLATQILATKDGGDKAHGTSSTVLTDGDGNAVSIGYTWVADEDVYFIVNVSIISSEFPADGDTQIKNAIIAIGAAYDPGQHVVAKKIESACFNVPGVDDVPSLFLGLDPAPAGSANIPIDARRIAKFDTSRIAVNHV